jgi:hypothetical protein
VRLQKAKKGRNSDEKPPGFSQNGMQLALAFHQTGHVRLCPIFKLSFEHDP